MKAKKLAKITFDNLENEISAAIIKKDIAVFLGDSNVTPFSKISDFLSTIEPERRYLGWDHKIYPQYVIEDINVK